MRRKVMVWIYRKSPRFEVLLLKRTKTDKGEWHPITGNVEPHEQVRAAAQRETMEEVALDVLPEPLGVTFTYADPKRGRMHETAFAAAVPADDDAIELSDEHSAHEWVTPAEAEKRLSWPEQKKALAALAARFA
ncbi:MAG TPA: NUDIX domain-containing protein [Candidatus Thermoplasmatota archaeon]|nr:NUDIX domain-containing protein [Candidatus Thermoplasmatota archaeon]